jgi:hypothetical protein
MTKAAARAFPRFVAIIVAVVAWVVPGAPAAMASSGYYAQVGAQSTDSTDHYATGFRAYLGHFSVPQSEPAGATTYVYFWVGDVLADGSFLQAGLGTNVNGCHSMLEFAYAFNPDGTVGLSDFLACGVTISSYAAFDSYNTGNITPGGQYQWLSEGATGTLPGSSFYAYAANVGTNPPGTIGELQSTAPITSSNQMGPDGANPTLRTRFGSSWYDTLSAKAYFGYSGGTRPPFNVVAWGYQHVSIGSGELSPGCTANGASLW